MSGRARPKLPGKILLLKEGAVKPRAKRSSKSGRFVFRFAPGSIEPGDYRVVYVPARDRAERSTSNKVTIK